jgi:hypothetical protein
VNRLWRATGVSLIGAVLLSVAVVLLGSEERGSDGCAVSAVSSTSSTLQVSPGAWSADQPLHVSITANEYGSVWHLEQTNGSLETRWSFSPVVAPDASEDVITPVADDGSGVIAAGLRGSRDVLIAPPAGMSTGSYRLDATPLTQDGGLRATFDVACA